jgi:hypothetical protein
MSIINIHNKYNSGHLFVVTGVAGASFFLLTITVFFSAPYYVDNKLIASLAFFVSGVSATIALLGRHVVTFNFFCHSLPYILFPLCLVIAGQRSNFVIVLGIVAVAVSMIFALAQGRWDHHDESCTTMFFRWPF